MKQFVGFILSNGKIEAREEKTRDFNKMDIPEDAIGGIIIGLAEPLRLGKSLLDNLEIHPVTYFGTRLSSEEGEVKINKGNWVRTRLGTLIEVGPNANIIEL